MKTHTRSNVGRKHRHQGAAKVKKRSRMPAKDGVSLKHRAVEHRATKKPAGLLLQRTTPKEKALVRFHLYYPSASSVFVVGTFNDWQTQATPLLPISDGDWAVEMLLGPGRYEYRYLVDGEWVDDPMAACFTPNPFDCLNAVLEI